jgi:hypothetical protein
VVIFPVEMMVEVRVPPRFLRKYTVRNFAFGIGYRAVRNPFQTLAGASEQGKASKNGTVLRKRHFELFLTNADQESQLIS